MRKSWIKGSLVAAVGALVLTALPALAADPTPFVVVPVPGAPLLSAVACPNASVCVAVGQSDASHAVVVSLTVATDPVGNEVAIVNNVVPVPTMVDLRDVSCPMSTLCEAVGQDAHGGAVLPIAVAGLQLTAGTPLPVAGPLLTAIDCALPTSCFALGSGQLVSLNITGSTTALVPGSAVSGDMRGVACPSSNLCVAVGAGPSSTALVWSITGLPGSPTVGSPQTVTGAAATGAAALDRVACVTAALCEAVGVVGGGTSTAGLVAPIAVSAGAIVPGSSQEVAGSFALRDIVCPSATACEAVGATNAGAALVAMTISGPSTTLGTLRTIAGASSLAGVGCSMLSSCVGVGAKIGTGGVAVPFLTNLAGGTFSTTTLSASPTSAVFGQPVTLTASVAASPANCRAGQATFLDGTTVLATRTVSSATATFSTAALNPGAHPITARFVPNLSTCSVSVSDPAVPVSVTAAFTTTTLSAAPSPATVGNAVTFTATVTATAPGAGTPTGPVAFKEGSTILGSASLVAGTATFTTSALAEGSHTITATYNGNTRFHDSTGTATEQINPPAGGTPTHITLSSSLNPSTAGDAVTITAAVTSTDLSCIGGVISFYQDNEFVQGSSSLTYTTPDLAPGHYTFTASYLPDGAGCADSNADPLTQNVNPPAVTTATMTTLASSLNPSTVGDPVTFTATVVDSADASCLLGDVSFGEGGEPFADGVVPTTNGTAQYTTSALTINTHDITAGFVPDSFACVQSTAPDVSQAVNAQAPPTPVLDLSIADSVGGAAHSGDSLTYTFHPAITVNPETLPGSVNLSGQLPAEVTVTDAADGGANWDCATNPDNTFSCNYTGAATTGALPPVTITASIPATFTGPLSASGQLSSDDATTVQQTHDVTVTAASTGGGGTGG
ncbi:MAG TPA: Ig-like domain repeat protein, partial [Sporichthyaceae bacterium]